MATVAEHIYAIQNILNQGRKSDDARYPNKLILHHFNNARLALLKQKMDRSHFVSPQNFQGFCMKLTEDTWAKCCDMPENAVCLVLRGCFPIPRVLSSRSAMYLKVSYLSGEEIGVSSPSAFRFRKYTLTKRFKPSWYIINDYIYIEGIPLNRLESVWVWGIFEDPTSVGNIEGCEDCYDMDTQDYPLSGDLVMPAYEMTVKTIAMGNNFPDDQVNNAKPPENTNKRE